MKRTFIAIIVCLIFGGSLFVGVPGQTPATREEADALMREIAVDLKNKDFDAVIAKCTRIIEFAPKSGDVFNTRAMTHMMKGEDAMAIEDFRVAFSLGVKPKLELMSHRMLGILYYRIKKFDETISEFSFVIERDDKEYRDYCYRGWSYFFNGEYPLAIRDLSAAITREPTAKGIRGFRAGAYMKLGEYQKAVDDITEDLRIDPKAGPEAYSLRAKAYRKLGKADLAAADEQKYAELTAKPAEKPSVAEEPAKKPE